MRIVQLILLVIGFTALGAVTCAYGLTLLALFFIPSRPGEGNWGAAIAAMYTLGCGGIIGAILGFACALRHFMLRGMDTWKVQTWIGVIVGLAAAVPFAVHYWDDLLSSIGRDRRYWFVLIFLAAAPATLGGIIGTLAGRAGKKTRSQRRRR